LSAAADARECSTGWPSTTSAEPILDHDGVQILVDDFSVSYLQGSEIDYVDSLMGAGFTVHNPNAVHSCSCGHSFDTGDDAGGAQACGCGH
jgi:iron-sulfur cluster assembly protein